MRGRWRNKVMSMGGRGGGEGQNPVANRRNPKEDNRNALVAPNEDVEYSCASNKKLQIDSVNHYIINNGECDKMMIHQ